MGARHEAQEIRLLRTTVDQILRKVAPAWQGSPAAPLLTDGAAGILGLARGPMVHYNALIDAHGTIIMSDEAIDFDAMETEIDATVAKIRPLLAGKEPAIQGAVIGELMAIWVAGHRVENPDGSLNRAATDSLRADLLHYQMELLADLVKLNEAEANER